MNLLQRADIFDASGQDLVINGDTAFFPGYHQQVDWGTLNRNAFLSPDCLRLACIITDTHSRLATGGMASTFPDGVSTC